MSASEGAVPRREALRVVLDTNVIVAAGFQPGGASAWLLDAIRKGALRMIWDDATRRETEHIVHKIPPLSRMPSTTCIGRKTATRAWPTQRRSRSSPTPTTASSSRSPPRAARC